MNIDEMKIGEAKQLAKLLGGAGNHDDPWVVGKKYLVRTCTMIQLGELTGVYEQELTMRKVSWIADTGRFHDAISKGPSALNEVEPMGNCIIGRGAIVDAVEWEHDLVEEQK
jgi:hypothetical protein